MLSDINAIPILARREIEARIAAPLIEAFAREFGREKAIQVASATIRSLACEQGRELARRLGGDSLLDFARGMEAWKAGGALEMEIIEQNETRFSFNMTRCRYAEMYKELGMADLGVVLSCGRDFDLIKGFNPELRLVRTQTIMEGAPFCDFRFLSGERDK